MNPWMIVGGALLAPVLFVVWMVYRPKVEAVIKVGDAAPDFDFKLDGRGATFSELWSCAPLAVIWLRHYG